MNRPPVALFVYKRARHGAATLKSLAANHGAGETDLHIFCEAAATPAEEPAVEAVAELAQSEFQAGRFGSVTVHRAEAHRGLAASIIGGVGALLESNETVVVVEDDLRTSPHFLDYMAEALTLYRQDERILSISGFNLPPSLMPIPAGYRREVYLNRRCSSWGWATWREVWREVDWAVTGYREFATDEEAQRRFSRMGADRPAMLQAQMEGRIDSWAIRWDYHHFERDGFCLYPVRSLVDNLGNDGSGAHCVVNPHLRNELDPHHRPRLPPTLDEDPAMLRAFARHYHGDQRGTLRRLMAPAIAMAKAALREILLPTAGRALAKARLASLHGQLEAKAAPRGERSTEGASLLFVNTLDEKGGAARIAATLKRGMAKRGYETTYLVGHRFADDEDTIKLNHPSGPMQGLVDRFAEREGWLDLFRAGPEQLSRHGAVQAAHLIHLHNLHGGYLSPFALAELARRPTVWTLHDQHALTGHCAFTLGCERFVHGCGSCPRLDVYPALPVDQTAFLWRQKKEIYRRVELTLVVPSEWLARDVARSILSHQDLRLIRNGIDQEIFRPIDRAEARRRLHLPLDRKILLFSADGGRANTWKGGQLVEGIYNAVAQREDLLFLVLGATKGRRVEDRLEELPYVADPASMALFYSAADLFVYPTLADNFSLGVLEALACGTPVISFDAGGVPEQIHDGENGAIVPLGDEEAFQKRLATLLDDEDKLASMARQARPSVAAYTIPEMLDQYEALYMELLQGRRPRG